MRILRVILIASLTLLCCQQSRTQTKANDALDRGGLTVTSSAFGDHQAIPALYTCDGRDAFPPLSIAGAPQGAKSLAIIFDDPDAPGGTWTHWVAWNIPPQSTSIADANVGVTGRNSWGKNGFGGPCPPGGEHRYVFHVYALDSMLDLGADAGADALRSSVEKHVVASGELVGVYSRKR